MKKTCSLLILKRTMSPYSRARPVKIASGSRPGMMSVPIIGSRGPGGAADGVVRLMASCSSSAWRGTVRETRGNGRTGGPASGPDLHEDVFGLVRERAEERGALVRIAPLRAE